MDEKATRKFLKPLKGNGELLKSGQRLATVRYFLQGWQDFAGSESGPDQTAQLSGMDGEITLGQEERTKIGPDQLIGEEFVLHTEKQVDYQIRVYKLKNNNPATGRYSIRCKVPG
jgi:hypothetical protein